MICALSLIAMKNIIYGPLKTIANCLELCVLYAFYRNNIHISTTRTYIIIYKQNICSSLNHLGFYGQSKASSVKRQLLTQNRDAGTRGLEIFFKRNGKTFFYQNNACRRSWCLTHKAEWRISTIQYSMAYIHNQLTQNWNLLPWSLRIILKLQK